MSGRAIWVWDTSIEEDPGGIDELVALCSTEGIDTVFYSVFEIPDERRQTLAGLASALHGEGIAVHALFGNAGWGLRVNHHEPLELVESILDYNREASGGERLDGIQDDTEVYTLAPWAFNPFVMLEEYLGLIRRMSDVVLGEMPLGAAVPFWFFNGRVAFEVGGVRKTLGEHLLDALDYVALMSYRDTADGPDGSIEISRPFVDAAGEAGKLAYVGQETQPDLSPPEHFLLGEERRVYEGRVREDRIRLRR